MSYSLRGIMQGAVVCVAIAVAALFQVRMLERLDAVEGSLAEIKAARGSGSRLVQGGGPPIPQPPSVPVSLAGAAIRGNRAAKVAVIEYSDFQCPFCGAFSRQTLPTLQSTYVSSGKVLWAYRHLPLENHQYAVGAAEAAACANEQGRFWEMHDRLFADNASLGAEALREHAKRLRSDMESFGRCLKGQGVGRVDADVKGAHSLGIVGTPTFLIGLTEGENVKVLRLVTGAQPLTSFREAIDSALSR